MQANILLGPFDVRSDNLSRISAGDAVELFHQLLVLEAIRTTRPVTAVSVPKAITIGDGGVDADVECIPGRDLPAGLIQGGLTRYQIKTGGFSLDGDGDIKELLLAPKFRKRKTNITVEHLQPRVRSCLDRKGTFVAVLFGSDLVGKTDDHGEKQLRAFLLKIDNRYKRVKIRILRSNQLCAAIKIIAPAMALRLNGLGGQSESLLFDIEYLGKSCNLEVDAYKATDELKKSAEAIANAAGNLNGFRHVRVLGDAGAGKTHLVYAALRDSGLMRCVLYCRDPEHLDQSSAFHQLLTLSEHASIVLVADECDLEMASVLQARLKNRAVSLMLISIFNETEATSSLGDKVAIIDVKPLEDAAMKLIFVGYGIAADRAAWLAELCRGSPRAAHLLGEYVRANPDIDYARHFSRLDDFWEAQVCAPDKRNSAQGIERLTIVRTIALFRRLGWESADGPQTKQMLLTILKQLDTSASPMKLNATVNILRRKRILQGVRTLYISPKLLHVTMWCNWWNNYADMVNIELLRGSIQGRMLEWFHDMFVYASESRAATRVAERLLAPEGPLASLAGLSIPGNPSLFFALAQASPKAALCTLKSALESATESEKKQFGPGRREIVHGLERLAVPATGFFDAVACLLLLAEAENEDWSNNASGVFVSMFTLGYGKVAASELAPAAKIPYLRDLLHSENRAWRALAVRALRESLSPFVTRIDIGEVQGLRSMALRWMPVNYNELWEAYKSHVELLAEASETLGAPDAEAAARGVMDHVRSLLQIPPLAPRVVELLRRFAQSDSLRDAVIESIVAVIHYDRKGLPESIVLLLKQLQTELTEVSFSARLRRYAGLQLLEDNFDDDGEYTEEIPQPLRELCSEALASPARLDTELPWLVTGKAKNGFQFGALLGEQDHSLSLWTVVKTAWLKAGEHRSDFFVGGYLAGLFKQDEGLWELVIGELFATPEARRDLTALVWRSGMSDAVAFELVALSRTWDIDPQTFRLFVYGGVVNRLPLAVVKNVIDILLKRSTTRDADVALDILQSRLWGHADEEVGLLGYLDRVLRHPAFIQGDASKSATDNMRDYHWTQGAKKLLGADQDRALTLAVECIAHFGCSGSVTDRYFAGALEFLDEFMGLRPVEMWKAVGNELGPKIDTKAYKLLQWLRGKRRDTESTQSTGLELVPTKIVMDWISKSSGHRSVLMAQYCPPIISPPLEQPSIARLILEKYGNSSDVRNALHANYFTGLFSGPPSAHYQNKLKAIEKQIAEEPNTVVRLWLQEEVESLTRSVQVELEREEAQEW